jgi:hypothetical protein
VVSLNWKYLDVVSCAAILPRTALRLTSAPDADPLPVLPAPRMEAALVSF